MTRHKHWQPFDFWCMTVMTLLACVWQGGLYLGRRIRLRL